MSHMKTNGDHPWMMSGCTTRKQAKNPPQKYREEDDPIIIASGTFGMDLLPCFLVVVWHFSIGILSHFLVKRIISRQFTILV